MDDQNSLQNLSQEDLQKLRKEFEDKIFKDLHLENLPPEEKEKFLEKLTGHVNTIILNTVIENLNEEQLDEIESKMQTAKTDEEKDQIIAEVAKNIPDLDKKIVQELDGLYNSLTRVSKEFVRKKSE